MFKKWKDIENSCKEKMIKKFFNTYTFEDEIFQVTEKIHGSNLSIIFYPDGHREYARRSGVLKDENFYNYKEAFKKENNPDLYIFLNAIQQFAIKNGQIIQLIGELFGKGVQKGIYYGEGIYWRWFGTYANEEFLAVEDEELLLSKIEDLGFDVYPDKIRVPLLCLFSNISSAKDFIDQVKQIDLEKDSLLTPPGYNKKNIAEGVVIRPYNRNYAINHQWFLFKYKHPKFEEIIMGKNKAKKPKVKVSEKVQNIAQEMCRYVNENRTESLFSKEGEIQDEKQIGEYIKLYLEDIYKDCLLDLKDLKKEEKKYINKQMTNLIVKELRRCL